MQTCAIYKIACEANGKTYFGQTSDVNRRFSQHQSMLRLGKHDNNHLQNAYNLYGENAFEYRVVEICLEDELVSREQFWLNSILPEERFNFGSCTASPTRGIKRTEKEKAHMSIVAKRRGISSDTRAKMAASLRGKPRSLETKNKISTGNLGKPKSIEAVRKKYKPIEQWTTENKLVKVWASAKEAGTEGFSTPCICLCAKGKHKTHKGFVWKYKEK